MERRSDSKLAAPSVSSILAEGLPKLALNNALRGVQPEHPGRHFTYELRQAGLPQLVQLRETLNSWSEEIAAMWRFTRNNGITEGFHNKMELINRQACGFHNFENYRMRVQVLCA